MKVVAKRFVNCKSEGWELGVACFHKRNFRSGSHFTSMCLKVLNLHEEVSLKKQRKWNHVSIFEK